MKIAIISIATSLLSVAAFLGVFYQFNSEEKTENSGIEKITLSENNQSNSFLLDNNKKLLKEIEYLKSKQLELENIINYQTELTKALEKKLENIETVAKENSNNKTDLSVAEKQFESQIQEENDSLEHLQEDPYELVNEWLDEIDNDKLNGDSNSRHSNSIDFLEEKLRAQNSDLQITSRSCGNTACVVEFTHYNDASAPENFLELLQAEGIKEKKFKQVIENGVKKTIAFYRY